MEPQRIALGVVIRATGEVPMDADVPVEHEQEMIAHLADQGHDVLWSPDAGYRIDGWQPPIR